MDDLSDDDLAPQYLPQLPPLYYSTVVPLQYKVPTGRENKNACGLFTFKNLC